MQLIFLIRRTDGAWPMHILGCAIHLFWIASTSQKAFYERNKEASALLALAGKDLFEYEVQSKPSKPWTFDSSLLYRHSKTSGELKCDVIKGGRYASCK